MKIEKPKKTLEKKGLANFERLINDYESFEKIDKQISNRKSKGKSDISVFDEAGSIHPGDHYSLNLEKLTERIEHNESVPLNFFKT